MGTRMGTVLDPGRSYDDIQIRYYDLDDTEIRYDLATRSVGGTLMRYGDIAELPWGKREKFEPGAFGRAEDMDVVLNLQHDRTRPLARTGPKLQLRDSTSELRIDAQAANTPDGDTALALVDDRVLRGFSVEFKPEKWHYDRSANCTVITRATLKGVGLVDKPAYKASTVQLRAADQTTMEDEMTEDEIRSLIEEALTKRSEDADVDDVAEAIAEGLAEGIADTIAAEVRSQVETVIADRDEQVEKRAEAEEAQERAEAEAEEFRQQAIADAEERADLLVQVRSLLPDDLETRGLSRKDILVAAAADEVEGAEERSEDYLLAKVEAILERREAAATGTPVDEGVQQRSAEVATTNAPFAGGVNINRMIEKRSQSAA